MSQTGPQVSHLHHEPIGLCIPCTKPGCNCWFKNWLGHTQHMNVKHPMFLHQPGSAQPRRPHLPGSGLPDTTNLGDTGAMDFGDAGDVISEDPDTHGSMFVPVILGSDKTTVSVATGQNDYYPLYASIGNIQNNGFSQCPKSLKPGMTTPEVARFGDGHYHHIIYGLGPYIADYEEQVLLACIVQRWCAKCLSHCKALDETTLLCSRLHVNALIEECDFDTLWAEYGLVAILVPFTNDFPRANIHELLAPDLLHQIIKGSFKDHLVEWVKRYLLQEHGKTQANIILDDIDRQIAVVPPFPSLCRFPQGRHFKQWTGDDSKALMRVYLPAIEGYVPEDVVDFCTRRMLSELSADVPAQAELTSAEEYNLNQQESPIVHQTVSILDIDVIADSKDIDAPTSVLVHVQLARTSHNLNTLCTEGEKHTQTIPALADELAIPHLPDLVRDFLVEQLYPETHLAEIFENIMDCPCYEGRIWVFNSAVSTFFAPSDLSGMGVGMDGGKPMYWRSYPHPYPQGVHTLHEGYGTPEGYTLGTLDNILPLC
ncbi:hypothetical protein DFJ58DRAFT_850583 [Suillus subalutaceus]|uniref:uncharacterized protein n=1 Tax=Suillus subalutaceus TaxID=48586 RepID=UPI001B8816E0|nr:uncharacterized protein DFJ58DRAFT_850583 [Suillus subalutaceus]KAG1814794.1 hypothetical protein DFJ58DRAFT_850583 [Suillus subalutaceus]